jgi:hypothetical protein
VGEKWPRILPKVATSTSLLGSFTCRKVTTWDRRLYFTSEGRRAEDFFRPKNPTASAGFEPANSGTKGRRSRYICLYICIYIFIYIYVYVYNFMRQRKFWRPNEERLFRDSHILILLIKGQGQKLIARSRYLIATPNEV